jgi:hypothetical protein
MVRYLRFPIRAARDRRVPSESLALFRHSADRPAVYAFIHGRVDSSLGLGLYRPKAQELRGDDTFVGTSPPVSSMPATIEKRQNSYLYLTEQP